MTDESVHTLVIGAGMSGLAYASFTGHEVRVVEAEHEPGGYCRTVVQDGFVWDYSGHFFHFRHPEIERYLTARMPAGTVKRIVKSAKIRYRDRFIDFPFQKNIHQLPQDEFVDCLYDLYFKDEHAPKNIESFADMLYAKFGRSIAEKFLIPYNEKLYATDLALLDEDAMGRFFPHADTAAIIRNFKEPDNASYNATFTYPMGGAVEYVRALTSRLSPEQLWLGERVVFVDLATKTATTNKRNVRFERLVSSAPLDRLLRMCGVVHEPSVFTSNKVLVFNLGFDRKGWDDVHWLYFPERRYSFYRVGFYDNIFGTERMSLYVELGMKTDAKVDVKASLARVLDDLRIAGVTTGQELVSWHSVVLDPAYVHITRRSLEETAGLRAELAGYDVHSIGRYGGWTYCAIEDNIVEARALVEKLEGRAVPLE